MTVTKTDKVIADAIYLVLLQHTAYPNADDRAFFRLDGFTPAVYAALLDRLIKDGMHLGDMPVTVRTTAPLGGGYDQYAIEEGRTPTYHRNNLPEGQGLILIFNRITPDRQSLANLHFINESLLAGKNLESLIRAAFQDTALPEDDSHRLQRFLRLFTQEVREPQLRSVAEFMLTVKAGIERLSPITNAISEALPSLGLFRAQALTSLMAQEKRTQQAALLKAINRAALDYLRPIDANLQEKRLKLLLEMQLTDEGHGRSGEQKRAWLEAFIRGQDTKSALELDWNEVECLVTGGRKDRKTPQQQRKELAVLLGEGLVERDGDQVIGQDERAVLKDLEQGLDPGKDKIVTFLEVVEPYLSSRLVEKLERQWDLVGPLETSDFALGVTTLVLKLLRSFPSLSDSATVTVRLDPDRATDHMARERAAFSCLYGGIDVYMPRITWAVGSLASGRSGALTPIVTGIEEDEEESRFDPLPFTVTVKDGEAIRSARLDWALAPHSAGWDLVHAVSALRRRTSKSEGFVPLFSAPRAERAPNIQALSQSIGPWWLHYDSLGTKWVEDSIAARGIRESEALAVTEAVRLFESAFSQFLETAEGGILIATDVLLSAYQAVQEAAARVSAHTGITLIQDLLNRSFAITVSDNAWVALPLLHPIKLLWNKGRCRQLDLVICKLLEPREKNSTANFDFLRRELEQKYTSAYFPAVLALGTLGTGRVAFLPDVEADGAELFRPVDAGVDYMDSAGAGNAAHEAVEQAVATVGDTFRDYLESYPFAKAGMRVLLANVHSPMLPKALLSRLRRMEAMDRVRMELVVHTPAQGALLYDALHAWINEQEELRQPLPDSYFPSIVLRIEEGELHRVLSRPHPQSGSKFDLVILVDAISEGKQKVVIEELTSPTDVVVDEFDPFFQPQHQIFAVGQAVRRVLLTPAQAPTVLRLYYRSQQICLEPTREIPVRDGVRFVRELELGAWATLLEKLHETAVWVVCYDLATDRFLLESTTRHDQVHIIRHRVGLGPKRLHNLTVSASAHNRRQVIRRLHQRLKDLIGDMGEHGQRFAQTLVEKAQSLSGVIVLAATGPGTKMNELLGLVMTQWQVEEQVRQTWGPGALIAWVYLDDHPDWFPTRAKRPDLLCVAARREGETIHLWLIVAESKFVSRNLVDSEYDEAATQVANGLKSLGPGLAPGNPSVECRSWYHQLQAAVANNLRADGPERAEWEAICAAIGQGDFERRMEGAVWVFDYEGGDENANIRSQDIGAVEDFPRTGNKANRRAVRETLLGMLNAGAKLNLVLPVDPGVDLAVEEAAPVEFAIPRTGVASAAESPAWPNGSPGVAGTLVTEASVGETPVEETPVGKTLAEESPVFDGSGEEVAMVHPGGTEVEADDGGKLEYKLLRQYDVRAGEADAAAYAKQALLSTARFYQQFGQDLKPVDFQVGPRVIRLRFELRISRTSTFDKLEKYKTDLKLSLKLKAEPQVRSGDDGYVWIDIPRLEPALIGLRRLLEVMPPAKKLPETRFPLGVQLNNEPFYADLRKVPHWLVGGTSGSGKSVFLRSVLLSLLLNNSPTTLRLVIIDPKGDLTVFKDTPFTAMYVSSRLGLAGNALAALSRIKSKMDKRLDAMVEKHGINEIDDYNRLEEGAALPRYVIIVEEFGDLLSSKEHKDEIRALVEQIAAIGRAPGFHLFVCTQNPVVENVSTDIKANCSGRVALYVKSHVNSKVILDETGAEDLLKNGDLLYKSDESPVRLQAPLVDLLSEIRPIIELLSKRYPEPPKEEI